MLNRYLFKHRNFKVDLKLTILRSEERKAKKSLDIFQVVDPETESALRSTHPFVGQMVKLMEINVGSILQSGATIVLWLSNIKENVFQQQVRFILFLNMVDVANSM